MRRRVKSISGGAVDTEKHEIQFDFTIEGSQPKQFVASYGAVSQITGALGRMFLELRKIMHASQGAASVAAEKVASSHIQRERWDNVILMQLTTPDGIPYTFALSPESAAGIADQLKTESAKPHQTGQA
jgi:hypothetical protein